MKIKKNLSIFLVFCLLFSCCPMMSISVSAADPWTYELEAGRTDTIIGNMPANCSGHTDFDTRLTIQPPDVYYDGKQHEATFTIPIFVGNPLPEISYQYSETEDGTYTVTTDTSKVGFYKASCTVGGVTAYTCYELKNPTDMDYPTVTLNPAKTADWTSFPTAAKVSVDIAGNAEFSETAPYVLYFGTLCTSHGLEKGTHEKAINSILTKANINYYLFSKTEDNNSKISDHENTDYTYHDKRSKGNYVKNYNADGYIWDAANDRHKALDAIMFNLYQELVVNKSTYDYIVLSFDSAALGSGEYNYKTSDYAMSVAQALQPYYDEGRVIWMTDCYQYDHNGLPTLDANNQNVKNDYSYVNATAENPPSNIMFQEFTWRDENRPFYYFTAVVDPDYFLNHKLSSLPDDGTITIHDIKNKTDYTNVDTMSDFLAKTLVPIDREYSLTVTDTVVTGLTPSNIKLQSSTDGTTWTDVSDVSPVFADGTITATVNDCKDATKYRLTYNVTVGAAFNPDNLASKSIGKANAVLTPAGYTPTSKDSAEATLDFHTHTWTYAVKEDDGATLTATCSNADCTATNTSLTISAPALTTYGGSESANAILSAGTLGGLTVSAADIKYYQKTNGVYGDALAAAPTAIGDYKATITVDTDKTAFVEYTISPLKLTIATPTVTKEKTYDGTITAAVTPGTLTNKLTTDTVNVTAVANYDNKNAGTGKTITVAYTISGTDAGKYIKPDDTILTDGVINAKQLTVTGTTVQASKTYNGNTTATVTAKGTLGGIVGSDDVSIDNVSADYDTKNVGTDKGITLVYTIKGNDSGNYIKPVNDTTSCKAAITQKQLTVTGTTASDRTYNAATSATATIGTVNGIEETDADDVTVSIQSASFADANAGTDKTVTVVYTISGDTNGNYIKPANDTPKATIFQKNINVTADNKETYVGSDIAELTYTVDPTTQLIGSDVFTGALATDANKNVIGNTYKITKGELTAGTNYNIVFTEGTYTVKDKNAQTLTFAGVTGNAVSKTYGDANYTETATGANTAVSYESSDTSVATVDANGEVTILKAGTTTITAKAAENNEYKSAETSYTLTVSKATPIVTTPPTASAITFGQTLADSTLENGVVSVAGTFTWTDNTIAPVVADSNLTQYDIVFTPDDTVNYNTIECKLTLTVNKAETTVITVPDASVIISGQALADSNLTNGEASVPGTFTWKDSTIVPDIADTEAEYDIVFTPDDSDNYLPCECKVKLQCKVRNISFTARQYLGIEIIESVVRNGEAFEDISGTVIANEIGQSTTENYEGLTSNTISFKITQLEDCSFDHYSVFVNGEKIEPDENGVYTVEAGEEEISITVNGSIDIPDDEENLSLWERFYRFSRALIQYVVSWFKWSSNSASDAAGSASADIAASADGASADTTAAETADGLSLKDQFMLLLKGIGQSFGVIAIPFMSSH